MSEVIFEKKYTKTGTSQITYLSDTFEGLSELQKRRIQKTFVNNNLLNMKRMYADDEKFTNENKCAIFVDFLTYFAIKLFKIELDEYIKKVTIDGIMIIHDDFYFKQNPMNNVEFKDIFSNKYGLKKIKDIMPKCQNVFNFDRYFNQDNFIFFIDWFWVMLDYSLYTKNLFSNKVLYNKF